MNGPRNTQKDAKDGVLNRPAIRFLQTAGLDGFVGMPAALDVLLFSRSFAFFAGLRTGGQQ
jgi:hypothetical protein